MGVIQAQLKAGGKGRSQRNLARHAEVMARQGMPLPPHLRGKARKR